MDFQYRTAWDVIKSFLIGWAVAGGILTVVSCIRHKEFIFAVFSNSIMAWVNAALPILIIGFGFIYLIKSFFR